MEKTERTKFITQDILKSSVIGSFQNLKPWIHRLPISETDL